MMTATTTTTTTTMARKEKTNDQGENSRGKPREEMIADQASDSADTTRHLTL